MNDQDTSGYWRKRLGMDEPVPADELTKHLSWHRHLRPLFYAGSTIPLRFYCPEKVLGLENIPAKPPYILAPNHLSTMDFVAVAWAMGKRKRELYTVATSFYLDQPFMGFFMRTYGNMVRIDTERDFFTALRAAARIVRAGASVFIHPEGLRSPDGNLLPFHTGVGLLAVETGVPLVPVHISGTINVMPTGSIIIYPHPITIKFGKPMDMQSYIEKKKTAQAYDVYKEVTEDLRQRIIDLSR